MFWRREFCFLFLFFALEVIAAIGLPFWIDETFLDVAIIGPLLLGCWFGLIVWTSALSHDENLGGDALTLLAVIIVFVLFGALIMALGVRSTGAPIYEITKAYLGNGIFDECLAQVRAHDMLCRRKMNVNVLLSLAGHIHTAVFFAVILAGFNWKDRSSNRISQKLATGVVDDSRGSRRNNKGRRIVVRSSKHPIAGVRSPLFKLKEGVNLRVRPIHFALLKWPKSSLRRQRQFRRNQ